MKKESKKNLIVKKFVKLCERLNRLPTFIELKKETGCSKDIVKYYFGSMGNLFSEAKNLFPEAFQNSLQELFNENNIQDLKKNVKEHEKFIITTAVVGCTVNRTFFKCLQTYCDKNDAKLLVLLSADPAATVTSNGFVDEIIPRDSIVVSNLSLNSNIHISTIKLSSKQIDPTTSLGRIGQREGSFIYASPKQRLKMVAVANNKFPHAIMTSGAVTNPDYSTDKYMSERTAYIANSDHVMGAIVVEIVDNQEFHFRQVQFIDDCFIDLGIEYRKNSTKKVNASAIVLGDLHTGEIDHTALASWYELIDRMKPKYIVLHDVFNGKSINPHEKDNVVEKSKSVNKGLTLFNETKMVAQQLQEFGCFLAKNSTIVISKSNHDQWLDTYLNRALYADDPQNHGFALKLANALVNENADPLQYAVESHLPKSVKNIKWLKRDEDFKIAGVQLSAHGDKGANGAKGSAAAMENAYGNCISAHSHTPEILRGVFVVGTTSLLRLPYNIGASSWLHTSCILYDNGSRQLINSIGGSWRLT